MQTFDILDPSLDIFQSRFLEASAGTGKTFAIEHLVIRLLLESEKPIELQEILAVTFTREAAHEMKTRIRTKLEKLLPEGNPRVRRALVHFDEIPVFTIHGFCHKMLTDFAFEAKVPLELTSPDQPDHIAYMRETVEDFIRTGKGEFAIDISALCRRNRYDLDRLIHRLIEAMQKQQIPREFTLPDLPELSFDKLYADFLSLAPRYKRMKFASYEKQVQKFAKYLLEKDPAILLEEKVWFFEKLKEEEGFFYLLKEKFLPQLDILRSPEEMLKRVAAECRKRWLIKAERSDHFTFDDLLSRMKKALEIPEFFQRVQEKYKAVIVDEFQDTDPIQWNIFEKLFLKTHLIYLVGDPKQSIYGFRSADIYTYMQAAKALGEEKKAYLDTNYRSSPPLIDSLNRLFTENSKWIDLPSMPDVLQYHPVNAGRKESKLDEEPIVFFGVEDDPGRERSWPTKKMEEEKLFPYIASELVRLREKTSFGEMAVLVKDRFQAQRLQVYFNLWKIPSTIKRTLNLAESRGFIAMEGLLRAITNPEKDSLVKSVINGPLLLGGECCFFSLKNHFLEQGFASVFSQFMTRYYVSHGDPTLYSELRQTAEILIEKPEATLYELLHTMSQLKTTSPEVEKKLQLRGDEDADRVPIMTTFASKGLEFDVVFTLGLASRHNEEENDLEKEAEKMRQLYVGFTRPKEKLYIPILTNANEKTRKSSSPIEKFFEGKTLPIAWIKQISFTPYQKKATKVDLIPPKKLQLQFSQEILTSFSAMATSHGNLFIGEMFKQQDLTKKSSHTLPLGAETGTIIHSVFEAYFQQKQTPIEQLVCETLNGTHLEGWEETISDMAKSILQMPLFEGFTLENLAEGDYFQEMEFLFQKDNQLIKGFADLVFKHNDVFYLLDWKTNWLGPSDEYYSKEALHKAMEQHDYYLQAKLYQEALQRYVKRFYIHPKFGGAFYIFLRGKKAVHIGIS